MDASRDGNCHKDVDEHTGLQRGATINIQVALLGGQTLSFETHLSATVSDIKALIHEQLGCHPRVQTLILDTTILADSSALLKDVAVNDGSLLSLTVSEDEPLGQSLLTEPDGKMETLNRRGKPNEVLNEFQLMSLQAAWESETRSLGPAPGDSPWGNLGAWGIDLYWTTRSNKCRYEYWSTAPGDNECGALIRIDTDSVTCIGSGSDDGLCVFRKFHGDRAAVQLVREGWPRFTPEEELEETNEDLDHSKAEEEAMKAIKAMRKLNPSAKKKAMKKLPLDVQAKAAMAMKASEPATAGNAVFDTKTGGGLFGAVPATTSGSLFGGPLATTGEALTTTGSVLFGAVPATTGGSLFGEALTATGSGLFGAVPATTGGSLFGAPLATTGETLTTTGSGLFGAVSATTGGSLFGAPLAMTGEALTATGSGLFGAVPATTGGSLFGAPLATTGGAPTTTGSGLFGAVLATTGGSLFGAPLATTGEALTATGSGLFGAVSATTGGSLFGAPLATTGEALTMTGSGLFGAVPATTGGSLFGAPLQRLVKH